MEIKGPGQRRKGASKLPFTPLDNLSDQREVLSVMANKKPTFDLHSNENALSVGSKFPRSSGGNIKDKISLWEGKEPSHSAISSCLSSHNAGVKRAESASQSNNKATDELSAERYKRAAHKEKENLGKENAGKLGDSRPCSPVETGKQQTETLKSSRPKDQREEDGRKVPHREKQDCKKVNQEMVGKAGKDNERAPAQSTQKKRAVFTLFKKLDAMGANHGKTPPELGNYFSPPNKDKQADVKKKESEAVAQSGAVKSSCVREVKQHQENVYTEPGTPPINPVPKPRRTFQHPVVISTEKSQSQERAQRNLPPLPSNFKRPSLKPPLGVYGRPRGERMGDNVNRYTDRANISFESATSFIIIFVIHCAQHDRNSFESEDLAGSTSPLFSRSGSQEHHYEDILGQSIMLCF